MSQQANNEEVTEPVEKNEGEAKGGEENLPDEKDTGESGEGEMSLEELQEELEAVRIALKRANRESAKRRLEIKELKGSPPKKPEGSGEEGKEAAKLQMEVDKLSKQLTDIQAENHSLKLRGVIRSKAADLKLAFYSEEALGDAIGQVQGALDEEYDDEDILAAIKQVAKARPYLFRKADASANGGTGSGTDAAKKGGSDIVVTAEEEAEIGKRFNIKT